MIVSVVVMSMVFGMLGMIILRVIFLKLGVDVEK